MSGPVQISDVASAYLAVLSAYHVWSGGISFFVPGRALRFYRGMYGCDPVETRHLMLVMRPWGALAMFAGAVGFAPFFVPDARPWVVGALAGLLVLRIIYRTWLRRDLRELSRITPRRNAISIAMLAGGVLVLTADLASHFIP